MATLVAKLAAGMPYLAKEFRIAVSEKTPFMIALPRSVQVTPTMRCNAFCPMCAIGVANREGNCLDDRELSADQIRNVLNDLKKLSGKGVVVSFANGEPTIWKPLWDALRIGRDLGFSVSFTTNGYTMRAPLAERVAAINPFNVGVSLESLRPEINDIMRPMGDQGTRRTIDAIDNLLAARDKIGADLGINIKTVIAKVNFETVHEIVERYADRPGVMWTPQPYRGSDEALWIDDTTHFTRVIENLIALKARGYQINASDHNLRDFVAYFAAGKDRVDNATDRMGEATLDRARCQIGLTTVFVFQDGTISLCPYMDPIGRLGDGRTLRQIWFGREARDRRKEIADCLVDCELSCTRRTSILDKVRLFLNR